MFAIPKKNGGVRPVFNLKCLNQYLDAPHFKMETIKEVSLMIKPNDYLVSIDLPDAFLHIGLYPDSRRFLRLKWRNQVYQYCTTAFGLASSPFVFTKVCKPILEHLRSQGFRISAYLDDWLLIAESKQLAVSQARQVVSLLQDLSWLINYKKSVLTPTQQLEHLGFVLNTRDMTALLPPAKLRDIRRSIKQVLDKPHRQSPRIIHSLTIRIQAATFAIFPARLYTRHLLYYKNQTVKSDSDWDRPRPLDQASLEELQWWYDNIRNSQDISSTTELDCLNQDRQYDQPLLHQQTRRNSISPSTGTSYGSLDMVSTAPNHDTGTTHSGFTEYNSRFRISPTVLQESMDDQTTDFSTTTSNLGPVFHRSLRRQNDQVITKVRILGTGSGCIPHGCVLNPMEAISEPIHKSSMESNFASTESNTARTTSSGNSRGAVLAECSVVSSPSANGSLSSMDVASTSGTNNLSQNSSPPTTAELDALRVEIIKQQLLRKNLHAQAVEDLLTQKLAPTGTNLGYRKNQLRFLAWAIQHNICVVFMVFRLLH
ncbi:hypothetical protein G6F42_021365 [Rhizopus arrhizus]|nr:hypothetical protein G6F42_021365 [Rhizopus arrhizus]